MICITKTLRVCKSGEIQGNCEMKRKMTMHVRDEVSSDHVQVLS